MMHMESLYVKNRLKGDLHLEWDVCGRLIKSRNAEFTAEYRYDALGRRIQKGSKQHHTADEQNVIYGWEGNTLAFEWLCCTNLFLKPSLAI